MDQRLEKALEFANYHTSLFNNKEHLKLKTDTMIGYAINGGIFKASIELINFTKLLVDREISSIILLDINGNPIEITNISEFHDELFGRYCEATNYYHSEYEKLRKSRSIKGQFEGIFDE